MTIGERIKQRRIELGLSQDELAKKMGYMTRNAIYQFEQKDNMKLSLVEKFAKVLETTPSYLMGWSDIIGIDPVSGYPIYAEEELLDVSDRSDFLNSFTHEEENLLRKIKELEKLYSVSEIERALDFIALYENAIPEIRAAVEGLLKSQKHDL